MQNKTYFFAFIFTILQFAYGVSYAQQSVFGKVTNVEDAGYPIYLLTLSVTEGDKQANVFEVNLESGLGLNAGDVSGLLGKWVRVNYEKETFNQVREISQNSKNLLNPRTPPLSGGNPFGGILSDAENETEGDLPDYITVTNSNGTKKKFDIYITPELAAANGKYVLVYYSETVRYNVTNIKIVNIPNSGGK